MIERIPFEEAINEPLLFQKPWGRLSRPQQVILKAMYGLPMDDPTDLRLWSAFSGAGVYDHLGYLVDVSESIPYTPQEYSDITLIIGRRSGKTHGISSFALAYEAVCGGHKSKVGDRQDPIFLQVAQDLQTARANLRQFILDWLKQSPVGSEELKHFGASAITADVIRLKNALITVGPPTIKLRSQAIAFCAMDELCVWPKDKEASNPDVEVERAVTPAMNQFYPFEKLIKVSTPLTEEGLLWQAKNIGTGGKYLLDARERVGNKRRLVLHAPTAAMDNPACKKAFLIEQQAKDPEGFKREYLALFAKAVDGFLSTDILRDAAQAAPPMRPPEGGHFYVAAIDPAFKHDDFALVIGHIEGGVYVQDYIHAWRGTRENPIRPGAVLDEINAITLQYGVRLITSDQYHSESLMELALSRGMIIEPCPLTGELKHRMWSDFNSLLMQRKVRLLSHPDLLDELMKMERVLTRFGNVQYAGSGRRDDLAVVTALNAYKAMQTGEPTTYKRASKLQSLPSQVKARVQARARAGQEGEGSAWWAV